MRNAVRRTALAIPLIALPVAGITAAHASSEAPVPHAIVANGNYTGVLLNGITVAFECHAAATGAVSVAINSCYLTSGGSAPAIALPGTAAATAGTAVVPFRAFQLCWTATATFVDSVSKPTSGCTLLPSVGGVPSLVGTGVSESS